MSVSEQVMRDIRDGLRQRRWTGRMPGREHLALELGVNHKTVEMALRQLVREGLLESSGQGKPRTIAKTAAGSSPTTLRIAILAGERLDRGLGYMIDLLHQLEEAGHKPFHSPKTLTDLGMNVGRVSRMVEQVPADAWIVMSASREILEWFAAQHFPAIALFGRRRGVEMAFVGPEKTNAVLTATRRLISLGHRSIVLVSRPRRITPVLGVMEQGFLNELAAHGIAPSAYNIPVWNDSPDGLHSCLESLFRLTPPTALLLDEAPLLIAAQQFLAQRGKSCPRDVSMICLDPDPAFAWCKPEISHIRWDSNPVVRHLVRWAGNIARGKPDKRKVNTKAEFYPGGTIGPARKTSIAR